MIVVVLGKPLDDGEELRKRVEKGLETLKEINADYMILSGGKVDPGMSKSEAAHMEKYLPGVQDEKIILEDKSKGTIGNAYFTRRIVDSRSINHEKIYLVTSCYHSERAKYIFNQVFKDKTIDASKCVEFENSKAKKDEQDSFKAARAFFQDIEAGDVDSIREKLIKKFDNIEIQ